MDKIIHADENGYKYKLQECSVLNVTEYLYPARQNRFPYNLLNHLKNNKS